MIRQATLPCLVGYQTKGKLAALSAPTNQQLAVFNARAWNRSGGAINVGICRKFPSTTYSLWTKVLTVYTQVTAALLAAGQVVATTTNDDGFLIASSRKFSFFGLTVSNTATGGTYVFQYWNGSAWTTLTTIENWATLGSAADAWVVFLPPVDWAVGSDASGPDAAHYQIRITHSTAPGDTGAINALWVAELLDYYKGLGDNNCMQIICDSDRPLILEQGQGLFPFFSTAHAANAFGAFYSVV